MFCCLGICVEQIPLVINTTTPQSILSELAQIQRLDRGPLSVIRQGPQGHYCNHQCYENGWNVSHYVPGEQVTELKEAIAAYHRFQELVEQ